MEGRLLFLFLKDAITAGGFRALCLVLCAGPALAQAAPTQAQETGAQQVIQPRVERRTIEVDQIDTEDFEIGVYSGLLSVEDFGVNTVIGARVAYHVSEGVFFEAAYAKSETSETSYERLSGGARLLTPAERRLTYYNISLGYNLLPGEVFIGGWAFNSAMYVIGGVGNTSFAGDDRFTVNLGFGYRFLVTDWLAIHADVRDHMFKIDLLGKQKTAQNLEVQGGITVFF